MSTDCYDWDIYYDNCICNKLKRLNSDTKIRVYYFGGQIDLICKRVKFGFIKGEIDNSPIYIDCDKVAGFYILPEDEWIKLEPGESYPLPPEPSEVSKVSFDAKTDSGTTSMITVFTGATAVKDDTVTEIPDSHNILIGGTYPIEFISLKNTGSSPIYIRNFSIE